MTDDEIDRMIVLAEDARRHVREHDNTGLHAWTQRVFTAIAFIPTLITIIDQLRGELILARTNQGGHLETTTASTPTRSAHGGEEAAT